MLNLSKTSTKKEKEKLLCGKNLKAIVIKMVSL